MTDGFDRGSWFPTLGAKTKARRGWGTQILGWVRLPGLGELGAVAAVEEVNHQADDQPDEEAVPGDDGQTGHEQEAEDDAERRDYRAKGNAEAAAAMRLADAQDDDSGGDQDEGEEGADVGEVGQGADVEEAGGNGYNEAGNPGGKSGGAEDGMDIAEDLGQQAVAGHGEPDPRLAELVDQDGGEHAHDGAHQNHKANPVKGMAAGKDGEFFKSVDYRGSVIDHRIPLDQSSEADGHGHIENGADNQGGDDADGQVALRVAALLGGGGDRVEADVGEEDD